MIEEIQRRNLASKVRYSKDNQKAQNVAKQISKENICFFLKQNERNRSYRNKIVKKETE